MGIFSLSSGIMVTLNSLKQLMNGWSRIENTQKLAIITRVQSYMKQYQTKMTHGKLKVEIGF